MTISLFNTLSRQKEVFRPLVAGTVTMYACGPTVYNTAHIGNLRTFVFGDIVHRVFQESGYTVQHAMNITDVGHLVGDIDGGDDKVEHEAQKSGEHPLAIAQKYEAKFFDDLGALHIIRPEKVMRATDAIPSQIELIQALEANGFTYTTSSAVYFDTSKVADYGKLTGQNLSDKLVGARNEVVTDTEKRNPTDFALWLFRVGRYEHHILHWPSPWGDGFPGWHVECSAISRELLGQPFDIHLGGVDLIGTHHTNEMAQSESAYGDPLAHYWMHGEHLLMGETRMGKSEGNAITLDSLRQSGIDPITFRYYCLTAHYRSKLHFSMEAIASAGRTLQGIKQLLRATPSSSIPTDSVIAEIWAYLRDDFDTPKALAALHEAKDPELWRIFDAVLGLDLMDEDGVEETIPESVTNLLELRNAARIHGDWEASDALRQQIEDLGYRVQDTDSGARLEKIT
jgi:cysteinyl-tRNA synthetase